MEKVSSREVGLKPWSAKIWPIPISNQACPTLTHSTTRTRVEGAFWSVAVSDIIACNRVVERRCDPGKWRQRLRKAEAERSAIQWRSQRGSQLVRPAKDVDDVMTQSSTESGGAIKTWWPGFQPDGVPGAVPAPRQRFRAFGRRGVQPRNRERFPRPPTKADRLLGIARRRSYAVRDDRDEV